MAAIEASPDAYGLARGPYEPQTTDVTLRDAEHNKNLPLRIYAPLKTDAVPDNADFPLIIFSHGAGGDHGAAPELLAHWASHGYVVVAPSHADSLVLRRSHGVEPKMDEILRGFARDPQYRLGRVEDISFVIDSQAQIEAALPELPGRIDPLRIGAAGHSAGAMTVALAGGASVENLPELRADERISAVLLLSGQGMSGPGGGFHADSWQGMDLPLMVVTGSHDNSPRTRQTAASRMHPYDYAPEGGDKHGVFINGALHMSFTGRAAGAEPGVAVQWLERYLGTPDIEGALEYDQQAIFACVKMATLAFWDSYLKDNGEAKQWLSDGKLEALTHGQVEQQGK